jgi:hypothetical protein
MKRLEESVRFCGDSLPFEASAKLGPRRRADGWREGICGGTAFSGHRRASHRLAVPTAPGTPIACPSKLQRSRVLGGKPVAREREFAKGIRKGTAFSLHCHSSRSPAFQAPPISHLQSPYGMGLFQIGKSLDPLTSSNYASGEWQRKPRVIGKLRNK